MEPTDATDDATEPTLKQTVGLLKDSAAGYISARKELAAIEAKEMASFAASKMAYGIMAAVFGLFTYTLFWTVAIAIGSKALENYYHASLGALAKYADTWMFVTLCVFLLHLLLTVIFLDKLRKPAAQAFFSHTIAEFKKDQTWLEQNKPTKES